MSKYEVVWHTEGVAQIEADNAEEAQQIFYESRDHYTEYPDFYEVEAIESPIAS